MEVGRRLEDALQAGNSQREAGRARNSYSGAEGERDEPGRAEDGETKRERLDPPKRAELVLAAAFNLLSPLIYVR